MPYFNPPAPAPTNQPRYTRKQVENAQSYQYGRRGADFYGAFGRGYRLGEALQKEGMQGFFSPFGVKSQVKTTSSKSRTGMAMTRRYRRRRFRRGRKRIRRIPPTLAPRKKLVRLKLCQGIALDPGAGGTIATVNFALNDIKDPEGASGTQQPLGFDQWAGLYQKFCVVGAKVWLKMYSSDATYTHVYGMHATTEANALTSFEHYRELPNTKMKMLSPDMDHNGMLGKYSIKRLSGCKHLLSEERYWGSTTGDPSGAASPDELVYLQVFAQPLQGQDGAVQRGYITIEYLIVFFDPVIPSRSTD